MLFAIQENLRMDTAAKKAVCSVKSAVWLGPLELVARVDDDRVADRVDGRVHDKWPSASALPLHPASSH